MSKRKKNVVFYLFHLPDYQMNYYEVEIIWNKDYGTLFDYYIYVHIYIYIYIYIKSQNTWTPDTLKKIQLMIGINFMSSKGTDKES